MPNKVVFTRLGGGPGYTLSDSDLWGLQSALQHLIINTSYFEGRNLAWARSMVEKIENLRGIAGDKDLSVDQTKLEFGEVVHSEENTRVARIIAQRQGKTFVTWHCPNGCQQIGKIGGGKCSICGAREIEHRAEVKTSQDVQDSLLPK